MSCVGWDTVPCWDDVPTGEWASSAPSNPDPWDTDPPSKTQEAPAEGTLLNSVFSVFSVLSMDSSTHITLSVEHVLSLILWDRRHVCTFPNSKP